ncbi:MAG TPA: hypothetical protein VF648_07925 [Pyrinomonadaceae bacterium]|jgi:hypothetical protein
MSSNKLSLIIGVFTIIVTVITLVLFVLQANQKDKQVISTSDGISNQQKEIKVITKAGFFQIVRTEVSGSNVSLIFKNNYPKSINGFHVKIGGKSGAQVELIYSETRTEIAPGEEYVYRAIMNNDLYTEGLIMSSVLFTDKSGDGEMADVKDMLDRRRGEKYQFEQILNLLKKNKLSSDVSSYDWENIKSKIPSLSKEIKNESPAFNAGLHHGKQRLKQFFEEMEDDQSLLAPANQKGKILDLHFKLEKIVSKL